MSKAKSLCIFTFETFLSRLSLIAFVSHMYKKYDSLKGSFSLYYATNFRSNIVNCKQYIQKHLNDMRPKNIMRSCQIAYKCSNSH